MFEKRFIYKNPFYADRIVLANGGVIETAGGTDIVVVDSSGNPTVQADIKLDASEGIDDNNGNELLGFTVTASAVNNLNITNAATGNGAALTCEGGDANIDLIFAPKGTGVSSFGTGAASGIVGSRGNYDLILQTGSSTTSSLTITDGTSGKITATLDGTGSFVVLAEEDGNRGGTLILQQDSASPAADDEMGRILFFGENASSTATLYGSIFGIIDDPTDGAELGSLSFNVASGAGSTAGVATMLHDGTNAYLGVGDEAAAAHITSMGAFDLVLETNEGTNSGTITITDGANGAITLSPNGSGIISVGNGASSGVIQSTGNENLLLRGGASGGSIVLNDSANSAIVLTPHGTGRVTATSSVVARSGTAIPAGGTAGAGLLVSSVADFGVFFGSGAPSLAAAKGSLYLRSDGTGAADRAYINTDGSTTWTALSTAA